MQKLLFLTPELPFPPQSGGKVKSLKLLDALAERYEVSFVSPLKMEDADHRDAFIERSPCSMHLNRAVKIDRSAKNLAASYLKGRPLNVHRTYDEKLAQHVAELAPLHDVIFLDHYEVAAYVPKDYKGVVVYHAHNAYHQIWNRYARLPGNPLFRGAAFLEAYRVRAAELKLAKRADLVFAAPNDKDMLAQGRVNPAKIANTYHLGDDSQLALPELQFSSTEKKIMYVGFLGWEANVVGLIWFIENVWPRLLQEQSDLKFDIVGKNPDQRLVDAAAVYPGITLTGFVEDLEEVYREARVSVAPLLFGSGMKVKVLDAMARGIPTVTTPVGAEGVDYVNDYHLSVAKDAEAMARSTLRLLEDEERWSVMCRSSRELIGERYTWKQLFASMHDALALTMRDHDDRNTRASNPKITLQHA